MVVTTDAEIAAAVSAGRLEKGHVVSAAFYSEEDDKIVICLSDGIEVAFPRTVLQGLEAATSQQLCKIEIEGPGTGLFWPDLEVAHYVPGLLDGVFGTKQWMATNGRKGGSVKTVAKAISARANGALGGRPKSSSSESKFTLAVSKVAERGPLVSDPFFIEKREQGDFAIRKANSQRSSATAETQKEAIAKARQLNPNAAIHVERVRKTNGGSPDKWRKI